MSYYPEYARFVNDALLRLDRSPSWLAQRLGVSPSTISRWLNQGARPRDPETVVRVADVLGLSAERQELLAAAGYGYQEGVSGSELVVQDVAAREMARTGKPGVQPPHNLPSQLTPLVGRQAELAQIADCLSSLDCRLLTIWGLGGMGKTRLALAAAEEMLDTLLFPDGIYYVPLAPLSHPNQIVPAIAVATDFALDTAGNISHRSPVQQLLDFLRTKHLLLVLDNLEHLPVAADLVTDVLQAAMYVKVLATSRERLRLPGEQVYPLTGLDYPTERTAENIGAFGAAQLFMDRACHIQPDYALSTTDVDDLIHICQVVDGMPLAIELAAAWVDTLTLAEIRQELNESLGFLAVDSHGLSDRHRSVEIAFDASWQRLTAEEQQVFAQLSVFRGGFSREAAGRVAGASLRTLSSLVGKSFVRFGREQGRYDIHELLRQFGAEQLKVHASDEKETRDRHAAYYCDILGQRYVELQSSRQQEALVALSTERGNLGTAWEWATSRRHLQQVKQAMDGLGRFYRWTGGYAEGAAAFDAVAGDPQYEERPHHARLQARALAWSASFELTAGHTDLAEQRLKRSNDILDALAASGEDMRTERALALLHRGHLELPRDLQEAIHAYSQSHALYRETGNDWEAAIAFSWLGQAHRMAGNHTQAIKILQEAQTVLERVGDRRNTAMVLENISQSTNYLGDAEVALRLAQTSLQLRRQIGDRAGIASSLLTLSNAYLWLGQYAASEPLLEEALVIFKQLGHRSGECRVYAMTSVLCHSLGQHKPCQANAEIGLTLARELGDVKQVGFCMRILGFVALDRGEYESAHDLLGEAIGVYESAGVQFELAWAHQGRAYSAWKLGKGDVARDHISASLNTGIALSDTLSIMKSLFFLSLVLATQGHVARAVEINALARRASHRSKSRDIEVLYSEPVAKMMAGMSPELVAEATARGHARDLFETAAEMLEEVQDPSWEWGADSADSGQ